MRTRRYERQNNCLALEMCSFCASGGLRGGGSHCREEQTATFWQLEGSSENLSACEIQGYR